MITMMRIRWKKFGGKFEEEEVESKNPRLVGFDNAAVLLPDLSKRCLDVRLLKIALSCCYLYSVLSDCHTFISTVRCSKSRP